MVRLLVYLYEYMRSKCVQKCIQSELPGNQTPQHVQCVFTPYFQRYACFGRFYVIKHEQHKNRIKGNYPLSLDISCILRYFLSDFFFSAIILHNTFQIENFKKRVTKETTFLSMPISTFCASCLKPPLLRMSQQLV